MAKPNYAFEKRQRELEAKRKKADKASRKSQPATQPEPESGPVDAALAPPVDGAAL
jgi:hypothetical protein